MARGNNIIIVKGEHRSIIRHLDSCKQSNVKIDC